MRKGKKIALEEKTGQIKKNMAVIKIQSYYRRYYAMMDLKGLRSMKWVIEHENRQIGMAKHLEVRIAPIKISQFPLLNVHELHRGDIRQIYDFGFKMKSDDDYIDSKNRAALLTQTLWRKHIAIKNFKKLVYKYIIKNRKYNIKKK